MIEDKIGGYGNLTHEDVNKLIELVSELKKSHNIKSGSTALFWSLVGYLNDWIEE